MFTIRKAEHWDLHGIAVVQVDSNRTTYAGIMPDEYLNQLSYKEKEDNWKGRLFVNHDELMYVAECPEHGIVGFVAASRIRRDDFYEGEVTAIYILQDFQGYGIGRSLIKAVASEYISENVRSMILWTLEENPARHFYEHLGGKRLDRRIVDRGGKRLIQVSYGWEDIRNLC